MNAWLRGLFALALLLALAGAGCKDEESPVATEDLTKPGTLQNL